MMDYRDAASELLDKGYSAQGGELFGPTGIKQGGTVRCSTGLYETSRIAWQLFALEADRNLGQKKRTRDLRGTILTTIPDTNRIR